MKRIEERARRRNPLAASPPLVTTSYQQLLAALQRLLTRLGLNPAGYGTHSFRKGAAQEMVKRGSSLRDILLAAGWKSAAFKAYLDMGEVEAAAAVELELSDSEDDSDSDLEVLAAG